MNKELSDLSEIKNQLIAGNVIPGTLLARMLADLRPGEIQKLRAEAANGMLGLELEKLSMANRFQIASADIDDFVDRIKSIEGSINRYTSFKATGEFQTASGRTTIEVKKGCYIATSIYGSEFHENVLLLKDFRDGFLTQKLWGRIFCWIYYRISPFLCKYASAKAIAFIFKPPIDFFCIRLRIKRFRGDTSNLNSH